MIPGLAHLYSGKVRDLYDAGDNHVLMVASDRLSAFDVVMNETIPEKGRVLTALTNYWLRECGMTVPSSLVSCDPDVIERHVPGFASERAWHGRSMLVRRAEMIPLECIVRGRLAGQAWEEYDDRGTVHGESAPAGMALTDAFEEPRFTPSTKADEGHDINISFERMVEIVGAEQAEELRSRSLEIYRRGSDFARQRGIIIAHGIDRLFKSTLLDTAQKVR